MKNAQVALAAGSLTVVFSGILLGSSPAHASQIIDFRSNGNTGRVASANFTAGIFTLTASGVNAPQPYVTASSTTGLCLFANTSDLVNRCGLLSEQPQPINYNKVGISSNRSIFYSGFNISQVLVDGFIDPNPPGTGELKVWRGQANSGTLLETINLASTPIGTTVNFSSPFLFNAGENIVFQASGSNSSIRLGSLTVEDVPGPIPLLGASAAFVWSRKLRRKSSALN
jgi:hypothetical protein